MRLVPHVRRAVRDAALDCLQELYRALQGVLVDNIRKQNIRPAVLREVVARLDQVGLQIRLGRSGFSAPLGSQEEIVAQLDPIGFGLKQIRDWTRQLDRF